MKLALAPLALALALAGAQTTSTYEVRRWVGDHDFLFHFRTYAQVIHGPSQDNTLSAWQKLPFAWKFFGRDVDGYFVSDNGYITFDRDAKVSVAASTALDDPAAPANSLFAFWTDIRLDAPQGQWDNRVWTATLGTSPDRVHAIYWLAVVPGGSTFSQSNINFVLALYENGEFESIFTSGRRATPIKATIGALSADRKTAVTAAGPGFDFPTVGFGGEDDVTYHFKPIVK